MWIQGLGEGKLDDYETIGGEDYSLNRPWFLSSELNFPLTFQLNVITMYLHFIYRGTIS